MQWLKGHLCCLFVKLKTYLRFIGDPEVGEDDHERQEELEAKLRQTGAPVTSVREAELGLACAPIEAEHHAGPSDGAPSLSHDIGPSPDNWKALGLTRENQKEGEGIKKF